MDIVKQLLGRLHPLLVHLPIGFVILGLLFQIYDRRRKEFKEVISTIYLWAGYSALLACITGYLQYQGEGYSFDSVKWHLWSGIATALFCFVIWIRIKGNTEKWQLSKIPIFFFSTLMFLLISFTGHQGGNITHGEDYLVEPLPNSVKSALGYEVFQEKEIVLSENEWQNAVFYEDIIEPIFNNYCVSCHNPKKAKGELLLNTPEGIMTSGENTPVVIANHIDRSDLFTRMELPKENDNHMPPDGKKQPSKEEIKLVGLWIENGLSFDKTIGDLGLEKSLFAAYFPKTFEKDYPDIEVVDAHKDSIGKIKETGLYVKALSESTNFLKLSALNLPSFDDSSFSMLLPVKDQIAVLDLGGTKITDAIFKNLATLPNLTILKLDNTEITGDQIEHLAAAENLRTINLSNSSFIETNLHKLKEFEHLEKVFLFNPFSENFGTQTLGDGKIVVEYGNYKLPHLPSDSIIY